MTPAARPSLTLNLTRVSSTSTAASPVSIHVWFDQTMGVIVVGRRAERKPMGTRNSGFVTGGPVGQGASNQAS